MRLALAQFDFPVGAVAANTARIRVLIERARDEPAMLEDLRRRAIARAPRFAPESERAALLAVVGPLLR